MIKILIVDDEKIERNGIRFLLKKLGMEMAVTEAENGVKALEVLEKEEVDILLTDIKMPFMDGLELTAQAGKKYPQMKMIIFSGYGEFEYARQAMKSGVENYILKPVNPEEFKNTLEKVIREMESESLEREIQEKSKSYIREHILISLLNGRTRMEMEKEMGSIADFSFIKRYKRMMLIEFNEDFFGKKDNQFSEKIKSNTKFSFQYLNMNQQQSVLFFDDAKEIEEHSERSMAQIVEKSIEDIYGEKCYIAVSDSIGNGMEMEKAYENLEISMENKFYALEDRIFCDNEEDPTSFTEIEDDTLMKQIRQDIKMKDMMGLRQHYEKLCEKYQKKKDFSQIYVKFIFSNFLKDIYESLPENEKYALGTQIDLLYRARDFKEVMNILEEGIHELEKHFSMNPQMVHREIETVKQYIYENYDKELSVDMLAGQVFMAPSYLSHIFKKETGQNLSKFIKSLRMEKAKEMLEESHNKIVNISYAVGYPNVSYFCQSFREYFGVSPQKYREKES